VAVKIENFQVSEDHWVLADLVGKGGHMRTVLVPGWVKSAVDVWIASANLRSGVFFRSVSKAGKVWGGGFTAKVIWSIVRKAARRLWLRHSCTSRSSQDMCPPLPSGRR
jgi:hypothetical protein